jgi:predicted nucleic acid-binding protein
MALICDTGPLYALYDADDAHHQTVRSVVESEPGPLYVPVVLLAELDYLLTTRLGVQAALDFLEGCETGAFTLVPFSNEDVQRVRELIKQYRDLRLGLADASVVATAERLGIPYVLTVDERHFRAITPKGMAHLHILPSDRMPS